LNEGVDGLFPIDGLANSSAPWEWWDTTRIKMLPNPPFNPPLIIANGKQSNPLMSKARALRYIDTIQGYICPRIAVSLGLISSWGVKETNLASNILVYPNPTRGEINIRNNWNQYVMEKVAIRDMSGKMVAEQAAEARGASFSNLTLKPGLYIVEVTLNGGVARTKVLVQ